MRLWISRCRYRAFAKEALNKGFNQEMIGLGTLAGWGWVGSSLARFPRSPDRTIPKTTKIFRLLRFLRSSDPKIPKIFRP